MSNLILEDFDLYYNGTLIQLSDGDELLLREKINYSSKEPDLYHTVIDGDTLTYLAYFYYNKQTTNSSKYWKYIADVNNIHNPMELESYIGKEIIIPDFNLMKLAE